MAVYSPISNNSFFFWAWEWLVTAVIPFLFFGMGMADAMADDIFGIQTAILNSVRLFV